MSGQPQDKFIIAVAVFFYSHKTSAGLTTDRIVIVDGVSYIGVIGGQPIIVRLLFAISVSVSPLEFVPAVNDVFGRNRIE